MAPLADAYDAFILDLDGVVYRGDQALPGAADAARALRERGKAVVFLTNNSARTPERVAERLAAFGIPAGARDVVTSAQAAASLAARAGARTAFVVGEAGVRQALAAQGIDVLDGEPERADVVLLGWDRSVTYDKLKRASVLVQRGARLVATNGDPSYPAPGGELWPGAGALLAAVETTTGVRAEVAGKPHVPLFEEAVARAGSRRALVVGDRLDTDVRGAAGAGLDAALVLTGAARPADLLDAPALPVAVLGGLGGLNDDRLPVRLRRAEPADAEPVRRLLAASGLADQDAGEGITLVAVHPEGGSLAATAGVDVRDGQGYLRSVAVTEADRGTHLGTLAVAAAAREAAAAGARRLILLTEGAEGFFERLGFEPIERHRVPGWMLHRASRMCSESATAMWRPLGGEPPNRRPGP